MYLHVSYNRRHHSNSDAVSNAESVIKILPLLQFPPTPPTSAFCVLPQISKHHDGSWQSFHLFFRAQIHKNLTRVAFILIEIFNVSVEKNSL